MRLLMIKLSPIEAITSSMFRTLAIARGLAESGNEVDFLCIPMGNISKKASERDFINEINVIRTGNNKVFSAVIDNNRNGGGSQFIKQALRKIWHSFSVYDHTYAIAKKLNINLLPVTEYDLVISSSDPKSSHVAVEQLKKQGLKYKRWIQYWGDPLALDITLHTLYPRFILKLFERGLIKDCDKVIYVSPITLKEQKKLFERYADKMTFLPIAYMEEEIYEETKNNRFVIGYYGNYSSSVRNIFPFYQACIEMHDRVEAMIYGDSDITLEETDNVKIYPRGIVDEHKKIADLEVCVLNSSGTQIPGKLYHLAGTNKKVLIILDGEYSDEIKQYLSTFNRFYMCENDKDSIITEIENIMADETLFSPLEKLKYSEISKRFIE